MKVFYYIRLTFEYLIYNDLENTDSVNELRILSFLMDYII